MSKSPTGCMAMMYSGNLVVPTDIVGVLEDVMLVQREGKKDANSLE